MANIQPIFDGEAASSVLTKLNEAIIEANGVDNRVPFRVATSANIANNATYTVDFTGSVLHTLNIASAATALTLAVSGLSTTERVNTIIFDNTAVGAVGVTVTFNDQSSAITFRRSMNEFPGTYPSMNIAANAIWEVNFFNESATVVYVDFNEVEE